MIGWLKAIAGGISAFKVGAIALAAGAALTVVGWGWVEIRSLGRERARLQHELGVATERIQRTVEIANANAEALKQAQADHHRSLLVLTRRAERAEIAFANRSRLGEEINRAPDASLPIPDAFVPFTRPRRMRRERRSRSRGRREDRICPSGDPRGAAHLAAAPAAAAAAA